MIESLVIVCIMIIHWCLNYLFSILPLLSVIHGFLIHNEYMLTFLRPLESSHTSITAIFSARSVRLLLGLWLHLHLISDRVVQ